MKKSILATAIASTLVFAAGAEAMSLKISGQVSKMIVAPDDASGDEVQFQDIGWSGSRFRFTGDGDIGNGMKAGFRLEEQLQSNASGGNNGGLETDVSAEDGDDSRDNRYQDIWVSGSFGKVTMGKGDGASNGVTEDDLSGTALSSSSNHQDNWGGYTLRAGTSWSSIFNMADGLSRQNRLRYDTPNFSGFSFAASTGQGGHSEIAARFRGDVSGAKVEASIGYADQHNLGASENQVTGGSVSVLLAGGFNVTVAHSITEPQKPVGATFDQEATTIKLGYKKGIHAFAVDYGDGTTETALGDNDADTWGLTWSVVPAKGVEFFATYRELDGDLASNASTDSIDIFAIGSRVRF